MILLSLRLKIYDIMFDNYLITSKNLQKASEIKKYRKIRLLIKYQKVNRTIIALVTQ